MKENFNFNGSVKYIVDNKTISTDNTRLQERSLNKDNYNQSFELIEKDLNLLYEKVRILQDCMRYSDLQLKNEILQMVDECKTTAKVIEESRDIIKNSAYIKHNVEFANTINDSYLDRNNESITSVKIREGKLSVAENILSSETPTKAEMKSKYKNNMLENNIDTMLLSKTYRSFYMFGGAINNKINEIITLKFHDPVTINFIDYMLSNCSIDKVSLKLIDDTIEDLKLDNAGKIKVKTIKEISISVIANNYIVSQLDYNELKGDFWNKLEEIKIDQNLYLDKDKFYYYLFGIDNLKIGYSQSYPESCFLSNEIQVGKIAENEYLAIEGVSSIERGSVEYYIVDGTNIIPILPEKEKKIVGEKIFHKIPLRFAYDSTKDIKIKQNGNVVSMSIEDAINNNSSDTLTVDYYPAISNIKILNEKIRVKAIIREYDDSFNTFVSSINIKKYGGGTLWIDRI